jgi:hypothetical protein
MSSDEGIQFKCQNQSWLNTTNDINITHVSQTDTQLSIFAHKVMTDVE